jgi:hypothetical protein
MSFPGFDAIARWAIAQVPPRLLGVILVGSQTDLDQGGTFRQVYKVYMGPSVGWVEIPQTSIFPIVSAGSVSIARGTNLITLSVNGNVTIQLPSSLASPAGPQAIPKQWTINPVVIVDIGGFASTNLYNILPFGSELISGTYNNTSQILRLSANYGAFILTPNITAGGWNLAQS